ncbi:MAG: leucine-rich repeat domain-containing protein [Holosporales bacterium]|jgi:hypothetical protein|nr:leucine-rich repeat domain-containing protein [Holosporales bacterium]
MTSFKNALTFVACTVFTISHSFGSNPGLASPAPVDMAATPPTQSKTTPAPTSMVPAAVMTMASYLGNFPSQITDPRGVSALSAFANEQPTIFHANGLTGFSSKCCIFEIPFDQNIHGMADFGQMECVVFKILQHLKRDNFPSVLFDVVKCVVVLNGDSIPYNTFVKCPNLEVVIFGRSILAIESSAFFNCVKLSVVALPDRLTCIDRAAFKDCHSLTDISFPVTPFTIGSMAFAGCGFKTLLFPPNLKIKVDAFSQCSQLQLILTQGPIIVQIPVPIFDFDPSATQLTVYFTTTECTLVEIYRPFKPAEFSSPVPWCYSSSFIETELRQITFPSSLKHIGDYTFANYKNLISVKFEEPAHIEVIGSHAFAGCGINIFTCPQSLRHVKACALYFAECRGDVPPKQSQPQSKVVIDVERGSTFSLQAVFPTAARAFVRLSEDQLKRRRGEERKIWKYVSILGGGNRQF